MSKHTPGPWLAVRCLDGYRVSVPIGHLTGECLGEVKTEANARLIAAAPEMLAVLKEAKRVYQEARQGGDSYDRLCAAIAKAEGKVTS